LNYYSLLDPMSNYADFGETVSSRYVGDFWHAKLVKKDNTWWTLPLNDFAYNSNSIMTGVMKYAIVDTGTSLLYIPPNDYANF
jgi:Eukaryotic aspartyl protease